MNLPVIGEIFWEKAVTELKAGISMKHNLKISFKCTSHQFSHGEKYSLGFTLLEKAKWTGLSDGECRRAAGSPLCVFGHTETTET